MQHKANGNPAFLSQIGRTPFTIVSGLSAETGTEIFVKREDVNPTGSHYDRLMPSLLIERERSGILSRGQTQLLDVSSGNSGASLAWASRALDYSCTLIMPEDLPKMRYKQAELYGATIIRSAAGAYIGGAIERMKEELRRERGRYHLINHAADISNVPRIMYHLGAEILSDLERQNIRGSLDFIVAAIGNGTALVPFLPVLDDTRASLIGFEPAEYPRYYLERHGIASFENSYGSPPILSVDHGLIGTGPGDTSFGWPLVELIKPKIDQIVPVYREQWHAASRKMWFEEGLLCGRTTAAAYFVAGEIARANPGSRILFIAYDGNWKYL